MNPAFEGEFDRLQSIFEKHSVGIYVPGCPPNPHALLHGVLLATGRLMERQPGSEKPEL